MFKRNPTPVVDLGQSAELLFELPLRRTCPACYEPIESVYLVTMEPTGGRCIGHRQEGHICGPFKR